MKKNGFTLLEILIALILFTVGVVAIAGLFGSGLVAGSDAENTTIAMNLAQGRMEEIKNLDFDTEIVNESREDSEEGLGEFGTVFDRDVIVTEPEIGLKQIIVTVYWTFKGTPISITLKTYISKN